jgi:uncharacterized protein (DUF2225 family)
MRVFRRDRKNPLETEELAELGPGAVVGEMAAMLNQPRSATVQAVTRVEVVELPTPRLRELTDKHSALLRVLVLALQERAGMSAEDINLVTDRMGMNLSVVIDQVHADAPERSSQHEARAVAYDRSLLYPRSVVCPVCRKTFSALIFRPHKAQPAERDSDFHQRYRTAVTPNDYEVWVCPNDLYAAFAADFTELDETLAENTAAVLNDLVASEWHGERPDFSGDRGPELRAKALQLALATYRQRGASQLRLAGILHRLAWCARENGDAEAEQVWLERALDAYEAGFAEAHHADDEEELRVQYLCGELARRLGRFPISMRWFGNALRHPALKSHPKWERLARDGMASVREQMAASAPVEVSAPVLVGAGR